MQILVYILAGFLALLGVVFIVGAQGQSIRIVIGVILLLGGGGLIGLLRLRPRHTTVSQKVDVSGDIALKQLKCRSCGGTLGNDSIEVKAGAVFVDCAFCGASYRLEEDVRW